jgi:VanZ family protein
MFRTVTATAAWTTLAFIAYATLCPLNERPELDFGLFSHPDHYLALAVAGSLFGLAYPRQMFFVCIVVLGSAVLLELLQLLTPDRHARVMDAVRKIIGGAIGIAIARLAISLYGWDIIRAIKIFKVDLKGIASEHFIAPSGPGAARTSSKRRGANHVARPLMS